MSEKFRILYLLLIFISYLNVVGQESYIDLAFGGETTGRSTYENYFQYGIGYKMRYPKEKAVVSFYEIIENINNGKMHSIRYAKTDLGFDFNFGNKLHFIIGGGVSVKFLIENNEYYNTPKSTVFGSKLNAGFGYRISPFFLISTLWQYYFDITPSSVSHTSNPNDKTSFIQLKIGFLIKNK